MRRAEILRRELDAAITSLEEVRSSLSGGITQDVVRQAAYGRDRATRVAVLTRRMFFEEHERRMERLGQELTEMRSS